MIRILSLNLIGLACGIGLYYDFQNRKHFKEVIDNNIPINGNNIITGTITCENTDIDNIFVHDRLPIPYSMSEDPFSLFELHGKNKIKFYDYDNYYYNDGLRQKYFKIGTAKYFDLWYIEDNFYVEKSNIKINGINLIYDKNLKIFYPKHDYHYLNSKKYLVRKYIPNNSNVTAFGKINKYGMMKIESIGDSYNVIDYVAERYFGISDIYTSTLSFGLIISLFYLLK
ncbi:hypothetical protein QJ850_gp566 [Acanthamoeba polyphaga mimivirus]|uniref:Uncharacterized protein n=1 Tax=Acanthamoeba polyphaga mimivirus Kroon TaxID=3069720 RepID=A0A0G2Y304_9VIRU|nr:hypothetical protein QJ850_gp566 [Acanthamoeba polyphaga mimivirus]AKI80133.1 hypothetical protein [Acanthamoeba polyphaga mimivirus Kroon]